MGWRRRIERSAAVLGAAAAITALAACGTQAPAAPDDDRPFVLTTFTVIADIAGEVAGDHLRVESITKVGAEIHGYEPTPRDLAAASDADLILDNGLGLEAWFAQFVETVDAPHVVVSEGVEVIDITEDDAAGGADERQANPHAWMSPLAVIEYVDVMVAAFSELDPAHAADFEANAAAYQQELLAVHDELVTALQTIPSSQRALVTCEGAFSYLARDAGLTERFLWAVNAEQQATPQRIAATIEFVREHDVAAVFCESTVSDAAMQQVVEATDARFGGILYVDSLSEPDGPVPTYLDLIRHDTAVIVDALVGGRG